MKLENFPKFNVDKKGTFKYTFWHWLAYNLVAMKLGAWKPKWLLHDIEKPWLKLIWGDYKRVQKWHKHHNKHHIFSGRRYGLNKVDWLAAVLDWESSRYSKKAASKTALEQANSIINGNENKYTKDEIEEVRKNALPVIKFLGLKV